jgi:hypothetical protein
VYAIVGGIVLLGALDLTLVARRYVEPQDVRAFHAENALITDILQKTGGLPVNIINYASRNVVGGDWLNTSLRSHGIHNIIPNERDPHAKERPVALALQNSPQRFWDAMGVRFVLVTRQQAEQLFQQRTAILIGEYVPGNGTIRKSTTSGDQALLLFERSTGGFPHVFFEWEGGVPKDQQAGRLAQSGKVVTDAPAPSAADPFPAQASVTFSRMRGARGVFASRAEVHISKPGLLVWNERYSPDLVIAIDGAPVPLHQANGVWCAVQIPPGKHTITCRVQVTGGGWLNLLALAASVAVVGYTFVKGRRRE